MKKRVCAFALAFIMVVSLLPANLFVFADTNVANVDDNDYPSFQKAWEVATAKDGNTIKMLADWNFSKNDSCLEVPAGRSLTIDMGNFTINRNKTEQEKPHEASDSSGNGTVFHVGKGAKLTIIGASVAKTKKAGRVIEGVWFLDSTGTEIIEGALITGGGTDSTDGGGAFRVEEGASVSLENVTIAGNVADQFGTLYGSGGAMKLKGEKITVSLVNSSIKYNYAERDGGGIYVDEEKARITLTNSHIDHNHAGTDGGGIFVNEDDCGITLINSTINNNYCGSDGGGICYALYANAAPGLSLYENSQISSNKAGDEGGAVYIGGEDLKISGGLFEGNLAKKGGAIYCNNDDVVISNATFKSNTATYIGGAIFLAETECTVRNCDIIKNKAEYGGGIYFEEEDNSLESCRIEENIATVKGGGAYAQDNNLIYTMKLGLAGLMYIRNNTLANGTVSNLVLENKTYIFSAAEGRSEIHIDCAPRKLSYEAGAFNPNVYYSDRENTYIKWDLEKGSSTYRHLLVVEGQAPDRVQKKELTPGKDTAPGSTSLKYTVKNENKKLSGDYKVIKGYARTEDADGLNLYYYTDGYFFNDPCTYDTHLATMSIVLEMSAFNAKYDVDSLGNNIAYFNRFRGVKQLLSDIGCVDEKTYISKSFTIKPTSQTIGFAISQKPLKNAKGEDTGYTLVPIVIRGQGYESEWVSNLTLGTSGEAAGFSSAAKQVFEAVQDYILNYGLGNQLNNGKIRFWVVGYSRAGATANLTSKRLIDAYQHLGNAIYGYTFEAPQGGMSSEIVNNTDYTSIHNTINYSDFVPYVAPVDMNFMRYGVDHFVPGSKVGKPEAYTRHYAGSLDGSAIVDVSGDRTTAQYNKDNNWYNPEDDEYYEQRDKMLKHLYTLSETLMFDDYFHLAEINLGSALFYGFIAENGSADVTMAEFLQDFYHYFQRWTVGENARAVYSAKYEKYIGKLVDVLMNLTDEQQDIIWSRLNNFWLLLPEIIVGAAVTLSKYGIDSEETANLIALNLFLMCLTTDDALGDAVDKNVIRMALKMLSGDYNNNADKYPDGTIRSYEQDNNLMMIGTFAHNISNIVLNHVPIVNYAWLRSYDSFYTDDTTKYMYSVKQAAAKEVKVPTINVTGNTHSGINAYYGDTVFTLSLANENKGGAIYYGITLNGKQYVAPNTLYNEANGITLSPMVNEGKAEYVIEAYTMWFDTPSKKITLPITVLFDSIDVTVNGKLYGTYHYGDEVFLDANSFVTDEIVFDKWNLPQDLSLKSGSSSSEAISFKIIQDVNLTLDFKPGKVAKPCVDIPSGRFNENKTLHFTSETSGANVIGTVTRTVEGKPSETIKLEKGVLELTAQKGELVTYYIAAHAVKNGMEDSEFLIVEYIVDKKSSLKTITIHATDNAYWENTYTAQAIVGEEVTIEAPYVQDEVFVEWVSATGVTLSSKDKKSSTLKLTITKNITLNLRYMPIVNEIEMKIPKPVAGEPLAEKAEDCKIKVTNVYSLDELGVTLNIDWSPKSTVAGYGTVYTAMIPVDQVKKYDFAVNEKAVIKINDGTVTGSIVKTDNGTMLCCTFPETAANRLTDVSPIEKVYFPHGLKKDEIKEALPAFVSIGFADGSCALAPIQWDDFNYSEAELTEQLFEATGSIDLKGINNPNKISNKVKVEVSIDSADKVAEPVASVLSGDYDFTQYVILSCRTENAKIYYTLDGTVPSAESTEYTAPIKITGNEDGQPVTTVLQAIAIAEEKKDSSIMSNTYTITLPVLQPDPTEAPTPTAVPTEAPTPTPDITQPSDGAHKCLSPLWIIIIIIIICIIIAVIVILVRKKKRSKESNNIE